MEFVSRRVLIQETNGLEFTSFGRLLDQSLATDTISIDTPTPFHVHQRSGTDVADIAIAGTYRGTPTAIEARFNGGAWEVIDASPSSDTYSGTLTNQSTGSGTLSVRFQNDTSVFRSQQNVSIGDVFLLIGDSISVGRGNNAQNHTQTTYRPGTFRFDDEWREANDPTNTGTSDGSHWPLLIDHISDSQSIPVGIITTGVGSTDLLGVNTTWQVGNSNYNGAINQATDAATGPNGVKAILCHLGPNAAAWTSLITKAAYETELRAMADGFAGAVTGAPKTYFVCFGELGQNPPDKEANMRNVRWAVLDSWDQHANTDLGPVLIDQDYSDNVHPKTDTDLQQVANRWWYVLHDAFYGGSNGRGPRPTSITRNAAGNEVDIVYDRDLNTAASVYQTTAFDVYDDGTPMTIANATRVSSRRVILALASSASGTMTVSFGNENNCVGVPIPLSTSLNLPGGGSDTIPAEPFYERVATAPSGTGGVAKRVGSGGGLIG